MAVVSRLVSLASASVAFFVARPVLAFLALLGFIAYSIVQYARSPLRKLPPGPSGVPILGNLFQLTEGDQWHTFSNWKKTYGDVFSLKLPGQRVVVLNSQAAANELLNRRAGKTSDRPRNIVAAEILTGGLFFVFTRYNNTWRRLRKAAHEGLNKSVVHRYHPLQNTEAILLASGLIRQPEHWLSHLKRNSASAVMGMIYDHPPIASELAPSVQKVNDLVARLTRAGAPGAHLVEFFPWMIYIPARFAKWKREAQEWHEHDSKMLEGLFTDVRERVEDGDSRPSLSATLIEDSGRLGLTEKENAWAAGTMYAAGSETTAGVMGWWMLAMLAYPEHQRRAQAEVDTVVGRSRLPTFADLDHLPYIHAMIKETMRWRPVDPVGMPHYSIEDDWYEGMFIPKNTVYIANVWQLNHDTDVYGPDADVFNPARYLDKEGKLAPGPADAKEDGHFTYGFGRRVCIGRHVANNALFINMALVLWSMNLSPGKDASGKPMELDLDGCINDGLVVRPMPFEVSIEPRSPEAVAILEEERVLTGY